MSHYRTLGVHQDASAHAIKMAYRRLVKIHHPDRRQEIPAASEEKMRRLNEAYGILSKTDKRQEYDESLKTPPPQFDHPTARAGRSSAAAAGAGAGSGTASETSGTWKSRGEELHEEVHGEPFLKRFRSEYGNRFESKDAFLAVLSAFFLMMTVPPNYFFKFGNIIVGWPFFGAAIVAGLAARFFVSISYAHSFKGGPDSLVLIALSNGAAAFAMGFMAKMIEIFLQQPLFAFPIIPAMLAALLPGAIGAGMGRAFSRTVGASYGMVGGALIAAVVSVFFGLWCVVGQMAGLGGNASSEALAKPLRAVIISAALAGALGSSRMNSLFIFSAMAWIETWLERFRPAGPRSKSVIPQ